MDNLVDDLMILDDSPEELAESILIDFKIKSSLFRGATLKETLVGIFTLMGGISKV